jgi:hypothetical protein
MIANVAITATEYLNRTAGYETFGQAILRTGPLVMAAQWGLWRSWSDAPSFLTAWAAFTLGGAVLRLLSVHFLVGERLTWTAFAGVSLVMLGGQLVRQGIK